jgi:TetR/AcrR family transcriptional regulator, ethionamide resistance regulator
MSTPVSQRRGPRVPREEARRRIVAAADRLLRSRRFRELTVEDLMAEAGLARTVFYRHFDGLGDLVLEIVQRMSDDVLVQVERFDPERQETVGFCELILRQAVALAAEHGPLLRAVEEAAYTDERVEAAYRSLVDRSIDATAALMEQGIAEGRIPPLDAREVSTALTLMNGAYLMERLGGPEPADPEVVLRTLLTVWEATIPEDVPAA